MLCTKLDLRTGTWYELLATGSHEHLAHCSALLHHTCFAQTFRRCSLAVPWLRRASLTSQTCFLPACACFKKPDNAVLGSDGHLTLVDFGNVISLDAANWVGSSCTVPVPVRARHTPALRCLSREPKTHGVLKPAYICAREVWQGRANDIVGAVKARHNKQIWSYPNRIITVGVCLLATLCLLWCVCCCPVIIARAL